MSNVRYFIVFMLFFASSLNYADRASLSLTKTDLSNDLGLGDHWMGWLMSAWGWSYVVAQIPCGWLLDRFGSKRVYGAGIFFWSRLVFLMGFAGMLHGREAFFVLFALLFLAGFALAPAFPGNGRFVAAWFPTKERGTASAIFHSCCSRRSWAGSSTRSAGNMFSGRWARSAWRSRPRGSNSSTARRTIRA